MTKIKAMALACALVLGSMITGVALVLPNASSAAGNSNKEETKTISRSLSITLDCSNPGGQQDVSKTPYVTNNTSKTLPKGKKLFWQTSDGDKGTIELDAPLKPGATAIGRGRPGQNYTCTASTSRL